MISRTKLTTLCCASLCALSLQAQVNVETFEYGSDDELLSAWAPSPNAQIGVSDSVAADAAGASSMRVEFNFPMTANATESITGPYLPEPIAIAPEQYLSFRVKGDPAFKSADFRNLYLYAYDVNGNFGRWGSAVPVTDSWRVANYLASAIEQPWNSPGLPDLSQIVQFAFYQYGSETAIPAYTAAIYLDELSVRDTQLVDTTPVDPVVTEAVIDSFDYASNEELAAAWAGNANAVVTGTTNISSYSTGTAAMQIDFNFPSMEWSTEVVNGPEFATPISIASTQYVSFRIRGDAAFAAADFRNLYLYAYDSAGNFGRWGSEVPTTPDWQIVNYSAGSIEKPYDSLALPDMNHIVRFAWFQYGSQAAIDPYTASIAVDDLAIRNTPMTDAVPADRIVEGFEFPSSEEIAASWTASANAIVSTTEDVSARAEGETAMQVEFNFPSMEWATEIIRGPEMETPVSILPGQYITFRVKGDPAFSTSDFNNLYLYAYDADGNFGRWGAPAPATNEWQVLNFRASDIEKPWDSTALPNLNQIVRFAFFQYGSQAPIDPYTATIAIDEIMIRNSALTEFPAPSQPREIIENFEAYPGTTELLESYSYLNSPVTTVTTASIQSPAPEGSNALKLAIDFAPGQYPWGSIRSAKVSPFSFPENGVLSFQFKGDPSLASVADAGTSFWISFYDQAARGINYVVPASVVTNSEWTSLEATLADFGDTSAVDIGNLVQWRILAQGWEGTAENAAQSAAVYVDDIRITIPAASPSLSIRREATGVVISWPASVTGFTLESSDKITGGTWMPVSGAQGTEVTVTPAAGNKFFRLRK